MSYVHVKRHDEYVTCPYDPAHRILAVRFITHLVKCKRNHSDVAIVSCPFNSQHLMKAEERSRHIATCPDKVSVERDFFTLEVCSGQTAVPGYQTRVACSENWDADFSANNECESDRPTSQPASQMHRVKFHNPAALSHLKPAEKRAYYTDLHARGFEDPSPIEEEESEGAVRLLPIATRKTVMMKNSHPLPCVSTPSSISKPSNVYALPTPNPSVSPKVNDQLKEELMQKPFQSSSSFGKGRGVRFNKSNFI
ncbi:Gametocyte specific factor [Chamberlinius hualienensis]